MALSINTNVISLNAQRNTTASQSQLATTMQRLSSGLRVNSARDDAAGLAIAERMNSQIRGMNVAIRNANDGVSLAQTAEGALGTITDMLQRMRELSVQAVNGTNTSGDIAALNQEYTALATEVGRTITSVTFNGNQILSNTAGFSFQVGASSGQTISANAINLGATNVNLVTTGAASALTTSSNAANAANIDNLDKAITAVNDKRSELGALQSRFETTVTFLQGAVEAQTSARGRIMDADFATETASLSRAQILQQAGTAMIAQANTLPQGVLALLR